MRVLHVNTARSWRGGEQQVALLMGELPAVVEQRLLCVEGGPLHGAVPGAVGYRRRGSPDPGLAWRIAREARSLGAQLVHCHDPHAHNAALLAWGAFGLRAPLVVARRVDFPIRGRLSARLKYRHPAVARIVCVSGAVEEVLAAQIGRERLVTVRSGIDLGRFEPGPDGRLRRELGVGDDVALVGAVAALVDHKDPGTWLRTAGCVGGRVAGTAGDQRVHFVWIGEGPLRAEVEGLAAESGLAVTFLGFRDDVDRLLPELDVFLFTPREEGLGTSLLDAMAAGVPVVATRAGGVPEIVDEATGWLADVGDDVGLAAAVQAALEDEGRRRAVAARAKVRGFSAAAMAEGTLAVYRDILGAGPDARTAADC